MIAPASLSLDEEQQQVLDALREEGRLVRWSGEEALAELPPSWVTVSGADRVWAVLRQASGEATALCHLLNRDYDEVADSMREKVLSTVTISVEAFGGRAYRKAVLYTPDAEPRELALSPADGEMSLGVPSLWTWAVVRLADERSLGLQGGG